MASRHSGRPATVSDHLAVALLNLAVALPTASLLWALLNGWPILLEPWLPARFIVWCTAVLVLAGWFFEDLCVAAYGVLWRTLVGWLRLFR